MPLSHPGLLILVFSIMAVQGGFAPWNIACLSIIFVVCLHITFLIWRQPESKTKLSFKVCFLLNIILFTVLRHYHVE